MLLQAASVQWGPHRVHIRPTTPLAPGDCHWCDSESAQAAVIFCVLIAQPIEYIGARSGTTEGEVGRVAGRMSKCARTISYALSLSCR